MYNKLNKKEQKQLLKLKNELLTDVNSSPSKNTTIYKKLRKIADKIILTLINYIIILINNF